MPHGAYAFSSWPRAIIHVDADAFFASCEQAVHPEYRGKVVITGGERGIVAAVSYEGKRLGITRAMSLRDVKKVCPNAIIVPSDYETYSLFSKRMFEVIRRFTNLVEEYSIDEAFADITGMRRPLHGSYQDIALRIKNEIQRELGITVSVGLSVSKSLAKIGSKHQKPNGFTAISGRDIEPILRGLPVEKIWGIGARTAAYCSQYRIKTALDFARQSEAQVMERFTKPHQEMWHELNGTSMWPVSIGEAPPQYTIGKTRTFTPPSRNKEFVFAQLLKNVENACIKARRHRLLAKGIIVYLKTQEFRYSATEATFTRPTAYPIDIIGAVRRCFDELYVPRTEYRATGVTLIELTSDDCLQMNLFEPPLKVERLQRLYGAVDDLAKRWGKHAVHLAGSAAAHQTRQHAAERGNTPIRKLTRVKGESERKHLTIPFLLQPKG